MNVRTIQRNALDSYLKLVRLPIDAAVRFGIGRGRSDSESGATPAELAIDRADAGIRAFAGRLIGDDELVQDAQRRRIAADERERAVRLKAEAEQRRQQATETAQRGRQQVKEEEQRAKQEAAEAEQRRKAAARKTAAKTEKAIESEARQQRLEQLDREAKALDEQEKALATADEAQRLEEAAAATKAARKRS